MNWRFWILLVTQAYLPWNASAFYYHELSRQKIEPQDKLTKDSYFGFSIAYDKYCKRLIVGAPRENVTGVTYRCAVDTDKCDTRFLITKLSMKEETKMYNQDFWIGASVGAGDEFVMSCAPRYVTLTHTVNPPEATTSGSCYNERQKCKNEMIQMHMVKSDDKYRDTYDRTKLKFEKFMDSFGWSVDVEPYNNSIIVGGPAMYTGRAEIYSSIMKQPLLLQRTSRVDQLPSYNLGYGVAGGKFLDNSVHYAVGSTYGRNCEGSVHIFNSAREMVMELPKVVDVEVVGSMFGAVLCAAKLQGERDDLLVGAPTYGTDLTYNTGAVYIYLSFNNTLGYKRKLVGPKDNSYFGMAIVSVGDLNGDNKDEVAIGAPHEDGRGTVYLYSGADISSSKKTITYLQRIQPEGYTSFGMSLAALADYDENGCNELAVGAPFDDAAVVYKCMASIQVKVETKFTNLQKRELGKTEHTFHVCMRATFRRDKANDPIPRNIIAVITTRVELSHPHARLSNPTADNAFIFDTPLVTNKEKYCTPVGLTLPENGNYKPTIKYKVSSRLQSDPTKDVDFTGSKVLLSDLSVLTDQGSVSAAECENDCIPVLNMTIVDKITSKPYLIGSSEQLSFGVSVMNTGDLAYDACIHVVSPTVRIAEYPQGECTVLGSDKSDVEVQPIQFEDKLLCKPKKLLRKNGSWYLDNIILDNRYLTSKTHSVVIKVILFSYCNVNKTGEYLHQVVVKGDPNGVFVTGETNMGNTVDMTSIEVKEVGRKIEQQYTITNNGKTIWESVICSITLKKRDFVNYKLPVILQYSDFNMAYTECTSAEEHETIEITCTIDQLAPGKNIKANIPINILPGKLGFLSSDKNITLTSNMTLYLEEVPIAARIDTVIRKIDDEVALWIIILAVIIGLLLLCLIAIILYKFGCFRRKNKENLKELRKSVRRQTIRRSMMLAAEARQDPLLQEQPQEADTDDIVVSQQ